MTIPLSGVSRPFDFQQVQQAALAINAHFGRSHDVAVVLGSGYDQFLQSLEGTKRVSADTIPHLPVPKVSGHDTGLYSTEFGGVSTLVFGGRIHAYNGHAFDELTFAVRSAIQAGAKGVLLTNAAGGAHQGPGSLVFHRSFHLDTPLEFFPTYEEALMPVGRFMDPAIAYDQTLIDSAIQACRDQGLDRVGKGKYLMWRGPMYEMADYVRLMRDVFEIDLFGMSTVPSTLAAAAMGARVLAVSTVSNWAKGCNPEDGNAKVDHAEVKDELQKNVARLGVLMDQVIPLLAGR